LDPDTTLRSKIIEFVGKGDFGLAYGQKPDGTFERVWFEEPVASDEVAFEQGVFLLLKSKAKSLKTGAEPPYQLESTLPLGPESGLEPQSGSVLEPEPVPQPVPGAATRTLRICGDVPPEVWNRLGTKILPKLRNGSDLKIRIEFTVTVEDRMVSLFRTELEQILKDLGLDNQISIEPALEGH
jgi:hypothetical protein